MKKLLLAAVLAISLIFPTGGAYALSVDGKLGLPTKTNIRGTEAKLYHTGNMSIVEMETQQPGLRLFGIEPDYDIPARQGPVAVNLLFPELGSAGPQQTQLGTVGNLLVRQTMIRHQNGAVIYTTDERTGALKFITVLVKESIT